MCSLLQSGSPPIVVSVDALDLIARMDHMYIRHIGGTDYIARVNSGDNVA